MRPKLTFEVKADRPNYHWRVTHRNGQILFASETFTRRNVAIKSMLNFITAVREQDYAVEIDKPRRNRPTPM